MENNNTGNFSRTFRINEDGSITRDNSFADFAKSTNAKSKYCKNCGTALSENAVVCIKCGVLVGDGNKFCPNCGAKPDPLAVICVKCGCQLKPIRPNVASDGMSERVNLNCRHHGFTWAIRTCFSKCATFSGRATRKEFWYWGLFAFLSQIVLLGLSALFAAQYVPFYDNVIWLHLSHIFLVLLVAWTLVMIFPSLAVTVRRLHDVGRSGWYYLIGLIPFIGAFLLLGKFCADSDGFNKYGPSPKLLKYK